MSDYKDWAHRRASRGTPNNQAAAAPVQTAPVLPMPPPGYAYAAHPQYGYILVPLQQMAPPPAYASPMQQPQGVIPYVPNAAAPHTAARVLPFARPKTCALVKEGDVDTYANMLANVPDLVPPSGYDAMTGNPSPETVQELSGISEYQSAMSMPIEARPTAGKGAVAPGAKVGDL